MLDQENARLIRPKLRVLLTFINNVINLGPNLPDNATRKDYDAIYYDIKEMIDDPGFETYAPPLPHLGTVGRKDLLWDTHMSAVIYSGTHLIAYLEGQLAEINGEPQTKERQLSCFLSHRFSEIGKSYAREVRQFLELVNIEVVEGSKFEPRSVSKKIQEQLDAGHDFAVLIISEDGESMWTRDEANSFWQDGRHVIVLVSEASEFEQGLQGDLEWIPFPEGHISEGFIKLLEGIDFIRGRLT